MVQSEQQALVDKMYKQRGYIHDFFKVMAAEDFDFLKAYNQLLEEVEADFCCLEELR